MAVYNLGVQPGRPVQSDPAQVSMELVLPRRMRKFASQTNETGFLGPEFYLRLWCGFMALFAVNSASAAPTWFDSISAPEEVPYVAPAGRLSRLKMVEAISAVYGIRAACETKKFPAELTRDFPPITELGLLGGIYINTSQQQKTSRGQFAIWSLPNSALTVEPYAFFQDFQEGRSCDASPFISKFGAKRVQWRHLSTDRIEVCKAWHRYFAAAKLLPTTSVPTEKQIAVTRRLLWKAHSYSLFHVWALNIDVFHRSLIDGKVPPAEFANWNAWNRAVANILPKQNWDSCAYEMHRNLHDVMPPCIFGQKKTLSCRITEPELSFTDRAIRAVALANIDLWRSFDVNLALAEIAYELEESKK